KIWIAEQDESLKARTWRVVALMSPLIPLFIWYTYHYLKTGYVFGNPEYFRYNVASTLSLPRFLLALITRLWQTFGYLHLWMLTGAMILAMRLPPVIEAGKQRVRITPSVQLVFLIVVMAYVFALALI